MTSPSERPRADDPLCPLRGALTWHITRDRDLVERVVRHPPGWLDAPDKLARWLEFEVTGTVDVSVLERAEENLRRHGRADEIRHLWAHNASLQKIWERYKAVRSAPRNMLMQCVPEYRSNLSLLDYIFGLVHAAAKEICVRIGRRALRAHGALVHAGIVYPVGEIKPERITETMMLGANGELLQKSVKDPGEIGVRVPALESVTVSLNDLFACFPAEEPTTDHAVGTVVAEQESKELLEGVVRKHRARAKRGHTANIAEAVRAMWGADGVPEDITPHKRNRLIKAHLKTIGHKHPSGQALRRHFKKYPRGVTDTSE
jgi:hypothetical protein